MILDLEKIWKLDDSQEIIAGTDKYIVVLEHDLNVDWETSVEHEKELTPERRAKLNKILNEAYLLNAYPTQGLRREQIRLFKRLVGQAMACGFEEDIANGEKMLAAASSYIQARSQDQSRFWYVSASAFTALPFTIIGCVLLFYAWLTDHPLNNGILFLISIGAGSLGALFSVVGRSGKLPFASSSGRQIHYLEAASRICTGAFAGLIVAFAVQNGVILSSLARDDQVFVIVLLAALTSGISERLFSSVISTIDSGVKKDSEGKK